MRKTIYALAFLAALSLAAPALAAARTLSVGLSGSDVTALQNQLIAQGDLAAGSNTGYFGALTLAAVKKFQCAQAIVCSGSSYGIDGPRTQAALAATAIVSTPDPGQTGVVTGVSLTGPYKGPLEFSGWVPDWRAASGTADTAAHLNQLTSVMPFGYVVTPQGTISNPYNIDQAPWPAFIAQAKAAKTRVIPTIEWGDGASEQAILSNATTRVALEDAIANLAVQNNYDGIDIDFEAKESDTKDYFSTFLKGLYERMGNKWVYCTVEARQPIADRYSPGATVPPDATEYANDYAAMNQYCDRVEIMAYDQGTIDVRLNAARVAPYAPVADPGWVGDLVTLAAQSIAKNKIIIGVPTYGYEYQVTPQGDGSYQYQVLWAFNPNYATGIAAQLGITPARTSADELGFVYNPNALAAVAPSTNNSTQTQQTPTTGVAQNLSGGGGTGGQVFNYVTWSDAKAIADKVALARQLGVRGVAVFSLGGAEDPAMWSVLK